MRARPAVGWIHVHRRTREPSMSQGTPNIARLVRQHAETARLLGVDFVPVYRDRNRDGASADAGAQVSPAASPQVAAPDVHAADMVQSTEAVQVVTHAEASLPRESSTASEPALKRSTPAATEKSTQVSGRVEAKAEPARTRSAVTEPKPKATNPTEARPTESKPADSKPLEGATVAESAPRKAAGSAKDPVENQRLLDALRARYEADAPHKNFVTSFTNIVFGDGDPCARLMFVGEAPGEEEDKTGRPFVGRAGQLLDKMIVAMGLRRQDVYIANVLKTRPPNNATPTLEESRLCAPYLYEQIAIVDPEVIVTLGLPATRTLLGTMEAMGKLRGKWANFNPGGLAGGKTFAVLPTYHPAYLLRNYTPQERAKVWSDLQMVMERLGLAKLNADPA
jgi:uracil-DNA glycosylase family 4